MRPTNPFRVAALLAFTIVVPLVAAGCGDDSGAGAGAESGADESVDRAAALPAPTIMFVNGLGVDVSLMPGIGTAAESRFALPGETVRTIGYGEACIGIARNGAVARIAMVVVSDRMTARTPAKCTDPVDGDGAVNWNADEPSGTRRLDSVIPETQWCLERLGPLDVQARIEPVGSTC